MSRISFFLCRLCLSRNNNERRSVINVQLKANLGDLNEVIVIGYELQKRLTLTGSVASVSGKEIQKRATKNVVNSLAGKLAGVRIVQNTAEPGRFQYQL